MRTRIMTACLAEVALAAVAASGTTAEAFPISRSDGTDVRVQSIQYRYGQRHYRHHHRAGLYNCGPGTVHSHLARKACGGAKFPRRF